MPNDLKKKKSVFYLTLSIITVSGSVELSYSVSR